MRGLELIKRLTDLDDRYKLLIYGKRPEDESWIINNKGEYDYYKKCSIFIENNHLDKYISFCGYLPREEIYNKIGYVLSLSDSDELPESFHLAPAEGACSGSVAILLNWPGVEYIYPQYFIVETIEEIANKIQRLNSNQKEYAELSGLMRSYVIENYGITRFLQEVKLYLRQIYL